MTYTENNIPCVIFNEYLKPASSYSRLLDFQCKLRRVNNLIQKGWILVASLPLSGKNGSRQQVFLPSPAPPLFFTKIKVEQLNDTALYRALHIFYLSTDLSTAMQNKVCGAKSR